MLSFTTDFKAAAQADVRDPRALVKVYWGNALSDKNVVITGNDFNYVDRSGQIRKEETEAGEKWAFIGNEFLANGTFHPMPSVDTGGQVGWFGSELSDGSGDFATDRWLQVAHDARPYSSITVVGDSEYDEYPVDFTVTLTHSGGSYAIVVTGNTSRLYESTFSTLTGVTAAKIEVSKWSDINTIVKITQFSGSFIETYDSSDIINMSILEESNTDTGAVPVGSLTANEIDLTLMNTDSRFSFGNTDSVYHEVLVSGRKIEAYLGFVLPSGTTDATGDVAGYIVLTEGADKVGYMPYGVYWSKDWVSSYGSLETRTTAYDMVARLRQVDFVRSGNYTDTVDDIIDEVLGDALTYIPDLTWSVSADIAATSLTGVYFEKKNFAEILKDISEATLSYTYVDRTGVLIVGSQLGVTTPVASEQELTLSKYFNYRSDPKIDELVNAVRVGFTTYTLGAAETIYEDETGFAIPAGETEVNLYLDWSSAPVLASGVSVVFTPVFATGAIVCEATCYAVGADIKVTGTAGDTFTLSATGQVYELTENTEAMATDDDSVSKYGQREFVLSGNRLVTSAVQAKGIADECISSYGSLRSDGSLTWNGSTLLSVGDTIEIVEFKSDTVETTDFFTIKRQTIEFDGGLHSEIEARRG